MIILFYSFPAVVNYSLFSMTRGFSSFITALFNLSFSRVATRGQPTFHNAHRYETVRNPHREDAHDLNSNEQKFLYLSLRVLSPFFKDSLFWIFFF